MPFQCCAAAPIIGAMAHALHSDEGDCNCTAMRKASRWLSQMYDAALAPAGLRSTQYSILRELRRRVDDPPLMGHLAEVMVMDRSTLGHNLIPLERDGLVRLEPSRADRRSKQVVITAEGRRKHAETLPLWREAQARFEKRFGDVEAAYLRKMLLGIAGDAQLMQSTPASHAKAP
jgi:DNA-binding MarR family transcriptional regulator